MMQPPQFGSMMPMARRPDPMAQGLQIAKMAQEMQAKQPAAAPATAPAAPGGASAPGGGMESLLPMLLGGGGIGLLSKLFGKGMGSMAMGGMGMGAMPGNEVSLPDPISALGG